MTLRKITIDNSVNYVPSTNSSPSDNSDGHTPKTVSNPTKQKKIVHKIKKALKVI